MPSHSLSLPHFSFFNGRSGGTMSISSYSNDLPAPSLLFCKRHRSPLIQSYMICAASNSTCRRTGCAQTLLTTTSRQSGWEGRQTFTFLWLRESIITTRNMENATCALNSFRGLLIFIPAQRRPTRQTSTTEGFNVPIFYQISRMSNIS